MSNDVLLLSLGRKEKNKIKISRFPIALQHLSPSNAVNMVSACQCYPDLSTHTQTHAHTHFNTTKCVHIHNTETLTASALYAELIHFKDWIAKSKTKRQSTYTLDIESLTNISVIMKISFSLVYGEKKKRLGENLDLAFAWSSSIR